MANAGPHTNGSQFFVSTGPLRWLERQCVAFGRVISGMRVVRVIEKLELKNERPVAAVVIDACGRL